MSGALGWIRRLIRELRRRQVIRVAVVYASAAFVVLQLGEILVDPFGLGGWALRLVLFLLVLGFPLAIGLAWVYNVTGEGVVREVEEAAGDEGAPEGTPEGSPLTSNGLIVGLLILAIGLLLYPRVFSAEESGGEASPAAPGTAQVDDRSIAVLPFEPLSSGEESETFAQGIHDDLLTRLANISDLTVISRTAVQQYRDTELTTGEIADSLGVRWVMEGGVQVLQNQIQVNAQLIDPRSEAHAWADDYQRDLTAEDLFAVQGEITEEIADALKAELTADEQNRITGAPTQDLKAYRLYVKGRSSLNRRTEEEMVKAVDYFKRAIRQDSTFAPAWAGLANATRLFPIFGPDSVEVQGPTQKEAARRALRLDPGLAEAHDALGRVYTEESNPAAALRHFQRAIDLKPSFAPPYVRLGYLRFQQGRPSATLKLSRLAVEINPGYVEGRVALYSALLATGRHEAALAQARTLQRRHPGRLQGSPTLEVYALGHLKRWKEARGKLRRWQAESGLPPDYKTIHLALTDIGVGDTSRARKRIAGIRRRGILALGLGLIHGALGENEAALSTWRRSVLPDPGTNPFVTGFLRYWYPDLLGPLRQTPRYKELIRDVNQARGFGPDGSIPQDVDVPTISTDR